MRKAIVVAAMLFASPVSAQDQSQFVPFTVSESDAKALHAYLLEQPFKFSEPVMRWIAEQERRAVEQSKQGDKAKE